MSKYHILYKLKPSNMIAYGSTSYADSWKYLDAVDSKKELLKIIENDVQAEYRVIKGEELEWDEKYETIQHTYQERVLKSRKLKE